MILQDSWEVGVTRILHVVVVCGRAVGTALKSINIGDHFQLPADLILGRLSFGAKKKNSTGRIEGSRATH